MCGRMAGIWRIAHASIYRDIIRCDAGLTSTYRVKFRHESLDILAEVSKGL